MAGSKVVLKLCGIESAQMEAVGVVRKERRERGIGREKLGEDSTDVEERRRGK